MVRVPARITGVTVDDGGGGVARIADGVAQGFGVEPGGVVGDIGPRGRQIHRGARDGGQTPERPLDARGAGTAVHAAQFELGGRDRRPLLVEERGRLRGRREHRSC